MKKVQLFSLALILLTGLPRLASGQPVISGRILLDTTRWNRVVYLSLIPDFARMYEISNESIIQESVMDPDGGFTFTTQGLSPGDHLYRIHIARQGDPRASLVIGGHFENHLFLVSNGSDAIRLEAGTGPTLTGRVLFSGYPVNRAIREIMEIAGFLDTLDFYGPSVNRDFVREAVYDRLRRYADTCSNPLVALFALYQSRFESDYINNQPYYRRFLRKWRAEDSDYFKAFRAQLGWENEAGLAVPLGAAILFTGTTAAYYWYRRNRKKPKSPYQTLTVQERKIFGLLKEGKSNKEISEICSISLSTVKTHINSIYGKLGIDSRTDVMDYPSTPPSV